MLSEHERRETERLEFERDKLKVMLDSVGKLYDLFNWGFSLLLKHPLLGYQFDSLHGLLHKETESNTLTPEQQAQIVRNIGEAHEKRWGKAQDG